MVNIKEKLDQIKQRITDDSFLSNKGLANEVGIHVFTYEPQYELIVRDYIARLVRTPSYAYRVIECNMYDIFLDILTEMRILDAVQSFENKKGRDYLLDQLQKTAAPKEFLHKMQYAPHARGDVLFLTGIGSVYPFMRAHKMLNIMQQSFSDIPIVLFYPGKFDGQRLILFNQFHDGNYYRAFNLI